MTWIVTGATGLLGPYLVEAIEPFYVVDTQRIELTDNESISERIKYVDPSVFIHAAAYTDVDGCEANKEKAKQINFFAVDTIAKALSPSAKLVYISTDMVYRDTVGPHRENDTGPNGLLNEYAFSKALGESVALSEHHNTIVLRTNFFGPSKNNRKSLSDSILADEYEVYYDDIFFSPLHMRTLAELVVECCERNIIGLFNAGSRQGGSKLKFAELLTGIMKRAGKSNFKVPRPHDMRMNVSRLERVLGRAMPTMMEEIGKMRQ